MICFKDKTFCNSPGCEGKCGRRWTQALHNEAVRWWNEGKTPEEPEEDPPVSFANFCPQVSAMAIHRRRKRPG